MGQIEKIIEKAIDESGVDVLYHPEDIETLPERIARHLREHGINDRMVEDR